MNWENLSGPDYLGISQALGEFLDRGAWSDSIDLGGSMRGTCPEATLSWIMPKLSAFGITRIADVTGLDRVDIPVVIAIRPMARSISVSQGKGLTLEAARVSAIMESIEVWHAEHLRTPAIFGSYDQIRNEHACIPIDELVPSFEPLHLSDASVAERWHKSMDLMELEELLIPEAALSMNTVGRSVVSSTSTPTTNGLASGNDLVEAICHSAFEIIERHGFSAWYQIGPEKKAETSIDLTAVFGRNASLIRNIHNAELRLNVFDLSEYCLGLPCYVAEIVGDGDFYMSRPYTGRGLHVSAEIALTRAITESAQSRLSMISGAREDNYEEDYYLWDKPQEARAFRVPTFSDPLQIRAWIEDPIGYLRKLLLANGFERWIIYDHTRRELGVPVIHGFIPGMDHTRI
jgi:ribosomal protein S12 methylthiotransferase accessory factor